MIVIPPPPADRSHFTIAVLCSLAVEFDAVIALLDYSWGDVEFSSLGKAAGDPNLYFTGLIRSHNIVVSLMGGKDRGSTAAAIAGFRASYPNVNLTLIVGICGAVPFYPDETGQRVEIVLGDVIVSDVIVPYYVGRRQPQEFSHVPKKANAEVPAFLNNLKAPRGLRTLRDEMSDYLDWFQRERGPMAAYPGRTQDRLFEATYNHLVAGMSCEECGCDGKLISRDRFTWGDEKPAVHFGPIASGDTILNSAKTRDEFAQKAGVGVIGFEWTGIHSWGIIPCVAIKGVCDYADSHRNTEWHQYAAAAAAACAKAILDDWKPSTPS